MPETSPDHNAIEFAERTLKYTDAPSEPNPRDAYVRIAPSICESIIP